MMAIATTYDRSLLSVAQTFRYRRGGIPHVPSRANRVAITHCVGNRQRKGSPDGFPTKTIKLAQTRQINLSLASPTPGCCFTQR